MLADGRELIIAPDFESGRAFDKVHGPQQAHQEEKPSLDGMYMELINAVGQQCVGETRHDTALRRILEGVIEYNPTDQSSEKGSMIDTPATGGGKEDRWIG
jgi:hypothetical protein